MLEDGFLANVEERGRQLTNGLQAMKERDEVPILDVRGLGLMIGVEFDGTRVEKGFASKLSKACLARGMIVLPTGIFETMRLIPPLTVLPEEIDVGLGIFEEALK